MSTSPPVIPSSSIEPGTLWVFTPSRTDPAHLEFILVQRQALLQDAVDRVVESATSGHKHHQLFVGPRGCGKSHLVTLIISRLQKDDRVKDRLCIAWLNEDETCTSLLELLIKIHASLEARHPAEFQAAQIAEAYELKPAQALDFVSSKLLAFLGTRTLLVVTENLDALFTSLGDSGQKQLRSFIQENSRVCFVATAQRLVESLTHRDNPFHGFFQTEHLKPLNVTEATDLLKNIANLHGKQDVVDFLSTSRGRSRVQALHHLSGGNHRIYIVLSQFITRDSMDSLLGPFMKMVDELTPYYQERLRWLPAQQRKIIEHLCRSEGTVPVKEIAKRLFATQQTISSQLQDLRNKGYVTANQRGRESLYEISEPLMRICVEVKENSTHEPLRLLVDFLRVWYDDKDLDERLGAADPASASRRYFEAALLKNKREGNLRVKILLDEIAFPEYVTAEEEERLKVAASAPESVLIAFHSFQSGDNQRAIECFEESIAEEHDVNKRALLLISRGIMFKNIDHHDNGLSDFDAAISLPGVIDPILAAARLHRGIAKATKGELKSSIEDYTFAINERNFTVRQTAEAFLNRGMAYNKMGNSKQAISDFTVVTQLPGVPASSLANALSHRSMLYFNVGEFQQAIADCTAIIKITEPPEKFATSAIFMRGVIHHMMGETQNTIEDLTSAINNHDASVDIVSLALFLRGLNYLQQDQKQESIADFDRVIQMPDAAVDTRIDAYLFLTSVQFSEGQWKLGFEMLGEGLTLTTMQSPPYRGDVSGIVGVIFEAGLNPTSRKETVSRLLEVYGKHQALPSLGEAVIQHIGDIFQAGAPFPSTDNLEGWAAAWEKAGETVPDFRLSLRLLRTAVNFVKAGGKDRTLLLDLAAPERAIVEQALGLSTEPQ